jgi:hypothetical protein
MEQHHLCNIQGEHAVIGLEGPNFHRTIVHKRRKIYLKMVMKRRARDVLKELDAPKGRRRPLICLRDFGDKDRTTTTEICSTGSESLHPIKADPIYGGSSFTRSKS